jgi:hypothetical protein
MQNIISINDYVEGEAYIYYHNFCREMYVNREEQQKIAARCLACS